MINDQKLLPIKEVVGRSRYSRDYIAKLAREGVIVGAQVGRQWFIDEGSLVRFTEASEVEAEVRRRHLSVERRRERELREEVERQWDVIPRRSRYGRARAVVASAAVLVVAFLSALTVHQVPGALVHIASLQKTQVSQTVVSERAATAVVTEFPAEFEAVESTQLLFADVYDHEVLVASSAVLFIPEGATSSAAEVAGMFSDPVVVTVSAPGQGFVVGSSSVGTTSIPFVTVPVAVAQDSRSEVNTVMP